MRRLSRTMWRLCRGQEAHAAVESALATLEPLGPGPELAWAIANLATQQMLDGENGPAIELARRAQSMAAALGVAEVLSDALNTEGCALAAMGARSPRGCTSRRRPSIIMSPPQVGCLAGQPRRRRGDVRGQRPGVDR
jgi:hypothetical protein